MGRDIKREEMVIELYSKGNNPTFISKKLDINRRSVYRILKRNEIELLPKIKQEYNCVICGGKCGSRRKKCNSCNTRIRRYRAKKMGVDYLGGECYRCKWSGDLSGFDFHHMDPDEKEFHLTSSNMSNRTWESVKEELDKCELLCALCHRLEHSDYNNTKISEIINEENDDLIFKR